MILLEKIDDNEFKDKVSIYIENINNGFERYISGILEYEEVTIDNMVENVKIKEDTVIKFIKEVYKINKSKDIYIDFYFENLSKESIESIKNNIEKEDIEVLENHIEKFGNKGVYFRLPHEGLIPFFMRLNTRELFFSTFYFNEVPMTFWGNYNYSFPMFFKCEKDFEFYFKLAKKFGLTIRKIK